MKGPVLFLVLAGAVAALGATVEDAAPSRPMMKVVNMLKDMQASLQEESENDQEVYNKMACWCNNNKAAKEKEIAESEARIGQLDALQKGAAAMIEKLKVEIKTEEEALAANIKSLDGAAEQRRKEREAFRGADKQYLDAIKAMESAITVLERNYKPSLFQKGAHDGSLMALSTSVEAHENMYAMVLSGAQFAELKAFLQNNPATAAYSAGGGGGKEILGMLKQMKEDFENNMSDSQKAENEAENRFQELKAAKEAEIQQNKDTLDAKNTQLAETMNSLSNADKERIALQASLKEAEAFLLEVESKCTKFQNEFNARVEDRDAELKAVAKALEILTSDEARAAFGNTFNGDSARSNAETVSFLQISDKTRRSNAVAILRQASVKLGSSALAQLASGARIDAFEVLTKEIKKVIADEKEKIEEDKQQRDSCTTSFAENKRETDQAQAEMQATMDEKKRLTTLIENTIGQLDRLREEIANANMNIKDAGNIRAKENAVYQQDVADQKTSIKLLEKALEVLKSYYNSFIQQKQPAGFTKREGGNKGGGAGKVLNFLEEILKDAKKLVAETQADEADAQYSYEQLVKQTNSEINAKNREIAAKTESKANSEKSDAEASTKISDLDSTILSLQATNTDLHVTCDFIMKNFETRQQRMEDQIAAMQSALQVLAGAGQTLAANTR